DGIRDRNVTGVQTCALPISWHGLTRAAARAVSALGRLRFRMPPAADEVWQAYYSLGSADARRAFLATLREVVDFQGQKVSAVDQIGRASCRERGENWGADGG